MAVVVVMGNRVVGRVEEVFQVFRVELDMGAVVFKGSNSVKIRGGRGSGIVENKGHGSKVWRRDDGRVGLKKMKIKKKEENYPPLIGR